MAFSLGQLLSDSAASRPDQIALVSPAGPVSYRELDDRATAVARFLIERGVRREDRVGLYLNRGVDSMAGIFGILRAGAAYVPLDSFGPPVRLAAALRNAGVRVLLAEPAKTASVRRMLDESTALELVVGADLTSSPFVAAATWEEVYAAGAAPVDVGVIEQDLAVFFHTSGSTGEPKAAVHSHRSMLANVEWAVATFDLVPEERVSNVTSHHFDLSWLELFATIAVGATLVQLRENTVKFPADLAAAMEAAGLTVWCSVPSILVGLVERGQLERRDLSSLRQVCFAGERFPAKHLRRLMELVPSPRYTNMYGTSETHIAAYHHLTELPEADQLLPIGRACEHVNLCAVRPDGTPCAPGESGELVIRGPSVMEGYWHLPERNELALAPVAVTALGPARCYHAGDLVIERTGGVFEILGRADRRIKVQGSLVDLDEVERVLFTQPAVLEAATYQVNPNDESAGVGASLVARPGETITEADVRAHAAALLPTHAVPVSVKIEQALPKNASGKLDRRALQDQATATPVSRARRAVEPGDPVRAFLLEELVDADVASILADDMELVSSGLLGSLGVFALVEFLGEELDIHVDDRDITEENFRSLAAIRALLARLAPRG